eukprot:scaffold20734_cov118-Isochrysis_galbana.AAC.8
MPFGLPVEPEVYRMKSGCDASTGLGGTSRHRSRTSSSSASAWIDSTPAAVATTSMAACALESRMGAACKTCAAVAEGCAVSPSTLRTIGGEAAAAAASAASCASAAHVIRTEAPTSSSRWLIDVGVVPPAIATYGTARRLAAWIHTTAGSPFGKWMAMRGAVMPASKPCRTCAAATERSSSSRREIVVCGPLGGSQMKAVSLPPPANTGASHSLKAALVSPPTNQRAV